MMNSSAQPAGNVLNFPARFTTTLQALPDGDAGVEKTIKAMRELAVGQEGALNPQIRALAIEIVRGTAARDDYAQASAIFEWVKANIEFRGEYDELLQTPLATAILKAGDCDDHSTLVYALLQAIGIRADFTTVATDPTDPERQFSHVFTSAYVRDQRTWVPLDTTVDRSYPGWQPEVVTRSQKWGMGDAAHVVHEIVQGTQPLQQALQERIAYGNQPSGTMYVRTADGRVYTVGGGLAVNPTTILAGILGLAAVWALIPRKGRR